MTHDELFNIIQLISSPTEALELIWGQPFEGVTQKITNEGEDHATTKRKLELAHNAIRNAMTQFEAVNMWEGDYGSKDMIECLEKFLPIPSQPQYTTITQGN